MIRLLYGLCLYLLMNGIGAVRRRLPTGVGRLLMRIELPLAVHIFWRGGGLDDAVLRYIRLDGAAYGPALAERLTRCPTGSFEARMYWVPLTLFLEDQEIWRRVHEYAMSHADPDLRTEMETTLAESKTW